MGSYYWIKMYHEVLHDPKMGRLSDHLWRRFFELCLIAGETQSEGPLPPVADMAWTLRTTPGDLEADLHVLMENGLIHLEGETWIVSKFADRQAAVSPTERWRQWRDRQRSAEYYQTGSDSEPNATPTNRLTDTDTDKIQNQIRQDTEPEPEPDAAGAPDGGDAAEVLKAFGMRQVQAVLKETALTPAQVIETTQYAEQEGLNAAILRTMLRQNEAHRPRAPDDDYWRDSVQRRKYIEGPHADIIEH